MNLKLPVVLVVLCVAAWACQKNRPGEPVVQEPNAKGGDKSAVVRNGSRPVTSEAAAISIGVEVMKGDKPTAKPENFVARFLDCSNPPDNWTIINGKFEEMSTSVARKDSASADICGTDPHSGSKKYWYVYFAPDCPDNCKGGDAEITLDAETGYVLSVVLGM